MHAHRDAGVRGCSLVKHGPHTCCDDRNGAPASRAWQGGGWRLFIPSPTSQWANESPRAKQLSQGVRRPPCDCVKTVLFVQMCLETFRGRACPPQTPCVDSKRNCLSRRACLLRARRRAAKGSSWLTPVPLTPGRWVSLRGASGGPHILQMRGGLSALPRRNAAPGWLQN